MRMRGLYRFAGWMVLGVALMIGTQRCYYDNAEELYPQTEDPNDTTVTFADDIEPFMTTYCSNSSSCHGQGADQGDIRPELVIYDDISKYITRIEERVLVDGNMPPSGFPTPTSEELADLQTWIDEGHPNN